MLNDSLMPGIIVLILSGLGFVAYRHPKGYKNIFYPAVIVTFFTVVSILAFRFGGMMTSVNHLVSLSNTYPKEFSSLSFSIQSLNVDITAIKSAVFIGGLVLVVLVFLFLLPHILGIDTHNNDTISRPHK
jgi:hypothetical protein